MSAMTKATLCTLESFAQHKRLDVARLRAAGIHDGDDGLRFPCFDERGRTTETIRVRQYVETAQPTRWIGEPRLYGLQALDHAREIGELVLVEGESDQLTLDEHGIPTIGVPGATMTHLIEHELAEGIKRVYVIREPGKAGKKFPGAVAEQLRAWGGDLLVVDLDGVAGVKDPSALHVADPERFAQRWQSAVEAARPCDEFVIAKLAALAPIEYDRARNAIAKKLGVRVPTLKTLVEDLRKADDVKARTTRAAQEAAKAEEARASTEPPSDAPQVDGAQLLDELYAFVRRFVILSDAQAVAIVLWVIHTHAFEIADSTPYLAINSAEKRCGKTRLLEVLETLVARAWLTGRTTGAALIRKVSSDRATLLLDESDAAFNGEKTYAEALRGTLNSGHRRGGSATLNIPRGDGWEAMAFDVFSPKAIAGIGKLPDTIVDRSIAITLRRRNTAEPVQRFRHRKIVHEADELAQKAAAWALANLDPLRDAEPELPEELDDRAQDGWEPLLAIADQASGSWRERARASALVLSGNRAEEDDSIGVQLLRDIKRVFNDRAADRLHTEDLLRGLHAIVESPWATWRNGSAIGARPLATRLREYGIRSKQVKIGDTNRHGYLLADFEDAFSRYLGKSEARNATDATIQSYQVFTAQSDPLPEVAGSVSELTENAYKQREVAPVADRIPYLARDSTFLTCEQNQVADRDDAGGRLSLFSEAAVDSIEREI